MSEITLSNNGMALIDSADFSVLSEYKWMRSSCGYAVTYIRNGSKRSAVLMHRLILNVEHGKEVDHINGNCLDNRRENLRVCSHAENMKNRKIHKNNKSGAKGVWIDARHKNPIFVAEIRTDGRKEIIGRFLNVDDAAKAYKSAAEKRHGEFHRSF